MACIEREGCVCEAEAQRIAGVDEAGRGPLAGPVIAAAVILAPGHFIEGATDSKALSARRREALAPVIRARSLAWAIGAASVEEIDRLNILEASLLAMQRAVAALTPAADFARVDGNRLPRLSIGARAIVRGDASDHAIACASILAKTHRDAIMQELDQQFPGYGFAIHAGYPTAAHRARLRELGPCAIHRRSFAPVRELLVQGGASS